MFERQLRYCRLCSIVLCILGVGSASAQLTKQQTFDHVKQLHQEANDAYQRERASPGDENLKRVRVQKFREVTSELAQYMKVFMTDKNSLNYLNNLYMLGTLSEGAENLGDAQAHYKECLDHPEIRNPNALSNGKAIFDLVNSRLAIFKKTAASQGGGGGGGSTAGPWMRVVLAPM